MEWIRWADVLMRRSAMVMKHVCKKKRCVLVVCA